jgi:uncharacterized protein
VAPRLLVDANVFLELELKQARFEECKNLLNLVSSGFLEVTTTDFLLDTIALVMEQRKSSPQDIRTFFVSIAKFKGLSVYSMSLADKISATEEMQNSSVDFDDATSLAAMKKLGIKEIVSFDHDFDDMDDITRVEPRQILDSMGSVTKKE